MYQPPKVKPLCPPENRPRYEDVEYAEVTLENGKKYSLKLDIYQDANQTEPGPCIFYLFGGGWMWGDYKQTEQKAVYCRDLVRLTKQGYTIVCPDYRLASQAIFPACIQDVKGAVRFIRANATKFLIDPERLGVLGNSAGGHLAAMIALTPNNVEIEGEVGGNVEVSSAVKAAVVFYAPVDICDDIRKAHEEETVKDFSGTEIDLYSDNAEINIIAHTLGYHLTGNKLAKLGGILKEYDTTHSEWPYIDLAKRCSPIEYVHAEAPPILICHGAKDIVVSPENSFRFYQALADVGADVTLMMYGQGAHGPSLGPEVDQFAYRFLTERL